MLKSFIRKQALKRLIEEKLYELSLHEINSGNVREGLWAKALANSGGDEKIAHGLYLDLRVQSMKDEELVLQEIEKSVLKNTFGSPKTKNNHKRDPYDCEICGNKTRINYGCAKKWLCKNCS